ncbi:hypothetical protein [Nucisporomicrobium flavum]|uniref:hypothetical protein n=1 Tax=Nucisporomicrobium flavum TaxID=2785915 RepID=UPI0018F3AFD4|nr:hypothetical protein [Nucisporomicrobium flavum]
MTDVDAWREQLAARSEQLRRAQALTAADRRDRRRRRLHGMVDRHAARLAHRRSAAPDGPAPPNPPDPAGAAALKRPG